MNEASQCRCYEHEMQVQGQKTRSHTEISIPSPCNNQADNPLKTLKLQVLLPVCLQSFLLEMINNKSVTVRATAVGRGAERDAERNAVLAGDPKGLVYYVMID